MIIAKLNFLWFKKGQEIKDVDNKQIAEWKKLNLVEESKVKSEVKEVKKPIVENKINNKKSNFKHK